MFSSNCYLPNNPAKENNNYNKDEVNYNFIKIPTYRHWVNQQSQFLTQNIEVGWSKSHEAQENLL